MAKAIMIQGTTSNAGKSLLTAGLCRVFMQDGYKVVPFKSQNMALNSFITEDGFEMGRAQVMQSEACGIAPDVRMNPILLKPTSDCGSQVIVNGVSIGNMSAKDYFAYKHKLKDDILKAYNELAEENDIIVIEGAGSPAEINLKQEDIVNMGMAKMANAPVLICGDIDRGGVFAALAGTMLLLEDDEKSMVKGFIINKFRGDFQILKPGLDMLFEKTGVPTLATMPYLKIDVDDEDSLSDRFTQNKTDCILDIAVIRLPRISNFTDFSPFEYIEGVNLRYVGSEKELGDPDMIILPGTKNTMGDLTWLRASGLENQLIKYANNGGVLFGVCGGYQMMGMSIDDTEHTEHGGTLAGMGLLELETQFCPSKVTRQLDCVEGIFASLSGQTFEGYEIHMGVTNTDKNMVNTKNIYGTYVHGIFDSENISSCIVKGLLEKKGLSAEDMHGIDIKKYKDSQYDILADAFRASFDMAEIYKILEEGING